MAALVLTVILVSLFTGVIGQESTLSLGSLFDIPLNCILNLLSCKETCDECGYCFEQFLDCVIDTKVGYFTNSTDQESLGIKHTEDPSIEHTEETHDDQASDIVIPEGCIDKYRNCIKGNCTECFICYSITIECVEQHYFVEDDSDEPENGPVNDSPLYTGQWGYPLSPFQFEDHMGYSLYPGQQIYPGSGGPWFPGHAEMRTNFPKINQLASALNLGQLPLIPSNFGFPIPQFETSTSQTTVESHSTDSTDHTTNGTGNLPTGDTERNTTVKEVRPTSDRVVTFQECLTSFGNCLRTCAICTRCLTDIQRCAMTASRPKLNGKV